MIEIGQMSRLNAGCLPIHSLCVTDAGFGRVRRGDTNGIGDHKFVSIFQPSPQPKPCVHSALPERIICHVSLASNVSGYYS